MSHTSKTRNLDFLEWSNDLAPLEKQSGPDWTRVIQDENRRFTKALHGFKRNQTSQYKLQTTPTPWTYREFTVGGDGWSPTETWSTSNFEIKAWDADIDESTGLFAAAVMSSDGYERFTIEIYSFSKASKPTRVEHLKMPCGPTLAWLNTSDLVYLQSSHDLRYDSLWIWSSSTMKSVEIYRTRDPTCNLEIKRLEDGSVAILETDFETTRFGLVTSDSVHWIAKGKDILPVTKSVYYVDQKGQDPIEAQSIRAGWTVKRSFGLLTIYDRDEKPITTVWGEVTSDTRDPTRLFISDIRYEPYWIDTTSWTLSNPIPYPFTVTYTPEPAPTFIIRPTTQEIKGLLVTAYGAYGMPTRVGALVSRWHPLLKAGWAIASVAVPGGGDHTQKWREKGQRLGRQKSIETLRQVVIDLQEDLGVEPTKTVLYGRSAGGLLVSSAALINPGLVGGLYIESPYIDILRTISNPELPLTLLETKEFGIGTNFTNVVETARWSPMEHLPIQGIPELFILARTDEQDLQVYPYEVIKFIQRARSGNTESVADALKLLQIGKGKGHFATTNKTREEDCWLLIKKIGDTYNKMVPMMRNRKNKTNRKNRNRMNRSRKNRNENGTLVPMMGGRRRRGRGRVTRRH
jgi:pimeloyl-ACP methyl ester carboxylesterase